MRKLFATALVCAIPVCSSHAEYGRDMTQLQIEKFCKVVDPTFLYRLPTIIELKNSGIGAFSAIGKLGQTSATNDREMTYLRTIYDADAKTVDQAINAIEVACVKNLQANNEWGPAKRD